MPGLILDQFPLRVPQGLFCERQFRNALFFTPVTTATRFPGFPQAYPYLAELLRTPPFNRPISLPGSALISGRLLSFCIADILHHETRSVRYRHSHRHLHGWILPPLAISAVA